MSSEPLVFNELFDDDCDFNQSLAEDYDLTPSTVSDDSSFSFQDDLTPTKATSLTDQSPLLQPPPPHGVQSPDSPLQSSYWSSSYSSSLPHMLPSYDPYLTASHYDYPQQYYYGHDTTTPATILEHGDMEHSNTTEDITFAEAFTALANFEPHSSNETENSARKRSNQHLETFNELSSGKPTPALL